MISVFVGQDGGSWSDSEIADGFEAIQRAGVWLEQQAIRYGARVNLGLAETYFQWDDPTSEPVEVAFEPEGDDVGPMEAHALTKSVVLATRAASSLGFTDVADWMARINSRVNADGWAWLFHLRQAGRSGAIPGSLCEIPGVGFAICYAREASFPEPLVGKARVDPSTIAHELLHLFGASDKYGIALKKFPNGSVSSKEIMRLNHDSLFRMTIDPLTASEIGWPPRPLPPPPAQKENARRPTSRKVGGRASQD